MAGAQSDVLVRMTANEAQAVQGFRNLLTSQQRTEQQTRRMNRTMRQTGRNVDRLGRQAGTLGRILGVGALTGIARNLGRAFEEQNRKAQEFEGSLRGLIAVGEGAGRISELRDSVADMMTTWALTADEASQVMQTLEDRAGGLEARFQQGLEPAVMRFSRLMNADANQTLNTSISLLNVFGDEVDSASHLLDMLKLTTDAGAVSLDDLSGRAREVAPALSEMGISLQEYLAAIAAASEQGMEGARVTRGLEQLVSSLRSMRREGEITAGTFPEMLRELAASGRDLDEDLGSAALGVAAALRDGQEVSERFLANLRDMGDADGLRYQAQEARRLTDSMQLLADFTERTQRVPEAAAGRVPEGARHFGAVVQRSQAELRAMMTEAGFGWAADMTIPFISTRLSDIAGFGEALAGSPLTRAGMEHRLMERSLRGRAPTAEDFADMALMGAGGRGGGPFAPHGRSSMMLPERREAATGIFERQAEAIEQEQDRRGAERERARVEQQELEELRQIRQLLAEQHQARVEAWHSLPPTQRMRREPGMRIERGRNAHGE